MGILQVAFLLLAILFIYLGLRLIIKFFPDFLSKDRLSKTEEFLSLSRLETIFMNNQLKTPYGKGFLAARLLAHLNILSYFISCEQKKQIKLDVAAFRQEFPHLLEKNEYRYCKNLFDNLVENLNLITSQDPSEFDYQMSLKRIREMQNLLGRGFGLIEEIEAKCAKLEGVLKKLAANQTEEAVEVVNSLAITFDQILDELATNPRLTINDLRDLSHRLEQIEGLTDELSGLGQEEALAIWQDHYEVLDLTPNANPDEIKKAYRRKILDCHPDKKQQEISKLSDPEVIAIVEKVFNDRAVAINEAYTTLSDSNQRARYDEEHQARRGERNYA